MSSYLHVCMQPAMDWGSIDELLGSLLQKIKLWPQQGLYWWNYNLVGALWCQVHPLKCTSCKCGREGHRWRPGKENTSATYSNLSFSIFSFFDLCTLAEPGETVLPRIIPILKTPVTVLTCAFPEFCPPLLSLLLEANIFLTHSPQTTDDCFPQVTQHNLSNFAIAPWKP